ncbi:MAG: hypothetical protein SGILL_004759 [Bacillariaceae sp.]
MRSASLFAWLVLHLLPAWKDGVVVSALPNRFIAEVVTDVRSIKGTFAPNPRHVENKPMLLLISKEGQVQALEDPDDSPHAITILDLADHICTNEERGLQNILVPPIEGNSSIFVYLYYSTRVGDCSATDEPWNVVARFEMNSTTLQLDSDTRMEVWRGTPALSGNHKGGGLVYGNDGKLYITTGDGGRRRNANDLTNLHGKVIRLNLDGSVPDDNPFVDHTEAYHCAKHGGRIPDNVTSIEAVCSEIFSYGLRNPFRVTIDPNENNKTSFIISEVGTATWEELNPAGTDYAGVSYGFPSREGPCSYQSTTNCDMPEERDEFGNRIVDPMHYYLHHKDGNAEGAAVSGAAFVPKNIGWPSEYEFLVSDFIFEEIYSLTEDTSSECRDCTPPISKYRNTTFFQSTANPGDDYSAPRIVDMFFGNYRDTQALYVIRFGSAYQNFDTILRIRYTDNDNKPPIAVLDVDDRLYSVGSEVSFSGLQSSDAEGEVLGFRWFFGDGVESTEPAPAHTYNKEGHYKVTMIVTDGADQSQQQTTIVTVGSPPIPTIISPEAEKGFSVGEVLQLQGTATYPNGTIMDDSYLEWSARRHQ